MEKVTIEKLVQYSNLPNLQISECIELIKKIDIELNIKIIPLSKAALLMKAKNQTIKKLKEIGY